MRAKSLCVPMMTLCLLLTACGGGTGAGNTDELALDIRAEYIAMTGCSATLTLTADYGRRVYDYTLALVYQREGDTTITVQAPEEVAGVTARISKDSAALEYDGVSLETGPLDATGLSPVSAVPAILKCAQEGFIAETAVEPVGEAECLKVTYRDPDAQPGTGVETSLWFHTDTHALAQGEILSDGAQIIRCTITDFVLL